MTMGHGRLVRDHTEHMVRPMGVEGRWYKADKEEFLAALRRKMGEEYLEFIESGDPIELWDLYDTLSLAMEMFGAHEPDIVTRHNTKLLKLGGFRNGIMWDPVPDGSRL